MGKNSAYGLIQKTLLNKLNIDNQNIFHSVLLLGGNQGDKRDIKHYAYLNSGSVFRGMFA